MSLKNLFRRSLPKPPKPTRNQKKINHPTIKIKEKKPDSRWRKGFEPVRTPRRRTNALAAPEYGCGGGGGGGGGGGDEDVSSCRWGLHEPCGEVDV